MSVIPAAIKKKEEMERRDNNRSKALDVKSSSAPIVLGLWKIVGILSSMNVRRSTVDRKSLKQI